MVLNSPGIFWRRTEWAWLALALFLHSLLLLIPYTPHQANPVAPQVINLKLSPFLAPDLTQVQVEPVRKKSPSAVTELAELPQAVIRDEPVNPPPDDSELPDEIEPAKPKTAAEIFQLVRGASLDSPEQQASIRLGDPPASTSRKGNRNELFSAPGKLNGIFAPAEVEIADRWLAADGSHNVVLNLPTGDTVCGRALPWDPLQPLVEHVMLFRPCGGGGKRSFSMDSPYSHRDVISNP